MASNGTSPRCTQSPLLRRKRDAAVANHQCVQVQWRFLQHQNPAPPKFSPGNRTPSLHDKSLAKRNSGNDGCTERGSPASSELGSPSKLFDMFANPQVEAEIHEEHKKQHENQLRQQHKRDPQQCRVLSDIMGETQRKAMLSRIMAEMEALALQIDRKSKSQRKRRGIQNAPGRGDSRERGEDAFASPLRKESVLHTALRNNRLSTTTSDPSDSNNISLLPQRRMSALGATEMEDLTTGNDTQGSEDDDDDDDDDAEQDAEHDQKRAAENLAMAEIRKLRKRHQRKQQRLHTELDQSEHVSGAAASARSAPDAHIFWQKSSRVKLALDIPSSLQIPVQLTHTASTVAQPTPRVSSSISTSPGAPSPDIKPTVPTTFAEEQQSLHNVVSWRRRPFFTRTDSACSVVSVRPESKSSHTSKSPLQAPQSPPLSPVVTPREARKLHAPYGAWYLPRHQWWPLHQTEQQALAERFPLEAQALAQQRKDNHQHDHCHHHPAQDRSHKPALVGQASSALFAGGAAGEASVAIAADRNSVSAHSATPSSLQTGGGDVRATGHCPILQ